MRIIRISAAGCHRMVKARDKAAVLIRVLHLRCLRPDLVIAPPPPGVPRCGIPLFAGCGCGVEFNAAVGCVLAGNSCLLDGSWAFWLTCTLAFLKPKTCSISAVCANVCKVLSCLLTAKFRQSSSCCIPYNWGDTPRPTSLHPSTGVLVSSVGFTEFLLACVWIGCRTGMKSVLCTSKQLGCRVPYPRLLWVAVYSRGLLLVLCRHWAPIGAFQCRKKPCCC